MKYRKPGKVSAVELLGLTQDRARWRSLVQLIGGRGHISDRSVIYKQRLTMNR